MSSDVSAAQIESARGYEGLLVPALMWQYTRPVLDAAQVESGQRVLDVACGTGVLTRAAAERVGPNGAVAGVDPGPGMLAVAEELAPDIDWQQGTAESLPFPDESFDAVVSQFGLMFFVDRAQAIREMLRVLKPGGLLAVAVWDSLENIPAYADEVALLDRMAGTDAADAVRAPYNLGDPAALKALFTETGVGRVSVERHPGTAVFPSIQAMTEGDLRGWLPLMGIELDETLIQAILAEAEGVLAPYETADGRLEFDHPALIVTGVKS